MKKILTFVAVSIIPILAVILFLFITSNQRNILYTNNEYGFSLEFPQEWKNYQMELSQDPLINDIKFLRFGFVSNNEFVNFFSVIVTPRKLWPTNKDPELYEQYESRKQGENEQYIFMIPVSGDAIPAYYPELVTKMDYIGQIQKSFFTFTPKKISKILHHMTRLIRLH